MHVSHSASMSIHGTKLVAASHTHTPMLQYRMPSGSTVVFGTQAIGAGTFGTVYSGTYNDGASVAVKFVQCTRDVKGCVEQEVELLRTMRHPNIIELIDSVVIESALSVISVQIMVRAVCSLQHCLESGAQLQPQRCACDIAAACSHLHARDIVHSDITTMNILLLADSRFVLSDFGVSCRRGTPRAANAFTNEACRAPECHIENVAHPASDMWSLGCVVAELSWGVPIMFHTALCGSVAHKIAVASTFQVPCVAAKMPCTCQQTIAHAAGWPDVGVYRMVAHCLQARPEHRCSADDAIRLLSLQS